MKLEDIVDDFVLYKPAKFRNDSYKIGSVMIFSNFQVRKLVQTGNRKIQSPELIQKDEKIILYHLAKLHDDPMYGCRVIGRGVFSGSPQLEISKVADT